MARRQRDQYMVTARYTVGWTNPGTGISSGFGTNDEAQARAKADDLVAEMRAAGAGSPIRQVTLRLWEPGGSLKDALTLFEASYYDPEQGLTEDQELAAKIHELHALSDRINAHKSWEERRWRSEGTRIGYQEWPEEFGDKPDNCPACGRMLHLDAVHYDNLLLMETIK
jgi:hypothetical protein